VSSIAFISDRTGETLVEIKMLDGAAVRTRWRNRESCAGSARAARLPAAASEPTFPKTTLKITPHRRRIAAMRIAGIVVIIVGACAFSACSSGSQTTPRSTVGLAPTDAPSAAVTSPTNAATTGAATPAPDASAPPGSFPQRCTQLVSNADIDALALQHLQLVTDSVVTVSGSTSQLACRFQGSGTSADTAIIVVASGYPDAATAISEDSKAQATTRGQGGTVTNLTGIADEAYAFAYPTLTGVAARKGSRSVLVGAGKLLGVPQPAEFTPIIQALLNKVGG
jgi:hypothetical protein